MSTYFTLFLLLLIVLILNRVRIVLLCDSYVQLLVNLTCSSSRWDHKNIPAGGQVALGPIMPFDPT
jgi:hypothetical protein